MESLSNKYQIARAPGLALAVIVCAGVSVLGVTPKEWEGVRAAATVLMMFCGGMLAGQHAAIWEKVVPSKD